MKFFVKLNGDTLEFQNRQPKSGDYVESDGKRISRSDSRAFPWYRYQNDTKRIRFLDRIAPKNTSYWFYNFSKLENAAEKPHHFSGGMTGGNKIFCSLIFFIFFAYINI